jgi:hypothetical protein
LGTYLEKIDVQAVSKRYTHLIARCREGDLASRVALYWRINYETMFTQLQEHASVQFLIYEKLALEPFETINQVFSGLAIPQSSSVQHYLSYSTSLEVDQPDATTTVRGSADYYRAWQEKISNATRRSVLEVTADSLLMPYFQPYYP